MKVYATLREELAQDPLLGDQTPAARQWLLEASGALCNGICRQLDHALSCAFTAQDLVQKLKLSQRRRLWALRMPLAQTAVALFALQTLDYNVPGGKLNRGMAVLDVLRALKGDQVSHARRVKRAAPTTCCCCCWWHVSIVADLLARISSFKRRHVQEITSEEAQSANILGWCIEWVSKRLSGNA
jgi:Polyprenyl synthetase